MASTEQIVIRGDLVEIQTTAVIRTMPLADLIPLIAVPPPITMPRLPSGTRFARFDPGEGKVALVVEVLPKIASMRTSRHQTTYRLTMPYQYYCFSARSSNFNGDSAWVMENYFLFWARESVIRPDAPVIPALLPNIYQDRGSICFGSTQPQSNQTLSQRIDQIVNEFDVTTFNGDLGWNRPHAYRSYAHWQAESRRNPLGWRDWPDWSRAQPLSQYLSTALTTVRPDTIEVPGVIPEIRTGWTFGRAGEWLESLSPQDRYRLVRTLHERRDLVLQVPPLDPDDYPVQAPEPETVEEPVLVLAQETATDEVGTLPAFDPATSETDPVGITEPRCACDDRRCACERVVLAWQDTCQACINGRHVYP